MRCTKRHHTKHTHIGLQLHEVFQFLALCEKKTTEGTNLQLCKLCRDQKLAHISKLINTIFQKRQWRTHKKLLKNMQTTVCGNKRPAFDF